MKTTLPITDAQILALRAEYLADRNITGVDTCDVALGRHGASRNPRRVARARARCAEILGRRAAPAHAQKKRGRQLDAEIAASLASLLTRSTRAGHARKRKPKTAYEIRNARLETLRGIMEDVYGDPAWRDTDLADLEGWINVDDDLTNREWLDTAKNQLVDQSVLPEHAGAPPANVYAWNDVFISTYRMLIDEGMKHADAIDSARQNANDTVELTANEHALTKTDPKLYKD